MSIRPISSAPPKISGLGRIFYEKIGVLRKRQVLPGLNQPLLNTIFVRLFEDPHVDIQVKKSTAQKVIATLCDKYDRLDDAQKDNFFRLFTEFEEVVLSKPISQFFDFECNPKNSPPALLLRRHDSPKQKSIREAERRLQEQLAKEAEKSRVLTHERNPFMGAAGKKALSSSNTQTSIVMSGAIREVSDKRKLEIALRQTDKLPIIVQLTATGVLSPLSAQMRDEIMDFFLSMEVTDRLKVSANQKLPEFNSTDAVGRDMMKFVEMMEKDFALQIALSRRLRGIMLPPKLDQFLFKPLVEIDDLKGIDSKYVMVTHATTAKHARAILRDGINPSATKRVMYGQGFYLGTSAPLGTAYASQHSANADCAVQLHFLVHEKYLEQGITHVAASVTGVGMAYKVVSPEGLPHLHLVACSGFGTLDSTQCFTKEAEKITTASPVLTGGRVVRPFSRKEDYEVNPLAAAPR